MPKAINYELFQGQSFQASITVTGGDGNAINLSGYSVSGKCRFRAGDTGVLFDLEPALSDYPNGIITIDLPSTGTKLFPVTRGRYDIELHSGDYAVRVVEGFINVIPEITF